MKIFKSSILHDSQRKIAIQMELDPTLVKKEKIILIPHTDLQVIIEQIYSIKHDEEILKYEFERIETNNKKVVPLAYYPENSEIYNKYNNLLQALPNIKLDPTVKVKQKIPIIPHTNLQLIVNKIYSVDSKEKLIHINEVKTSNGIIIPLIYIDLPYGFLL